VGVMEVGCQYRVVIRQDFFFFEKKFHHSETV